MSESMSGQKLVIGASVLLLLVFFFYVPAMRGGYIWDDDSHVTENAALRDAGGLRRIWFDIGAVPQYYPLAHTTFWLEYHCWGLNPLGYHIINVLLHALNAMVLWRVLRFLKLPGAWAAAAIFAVHPVHVESVAWITERKNVLSGFFYLSALWAYLRFLQADEDKSGMEPKWRWYGLASGLFVCSLLSKTVTSTLPAAVLLLIWWRHGRVTGRDVVFLLPYFFTGIAFGLLTVWMEKHGVGAKGEPWDLSLIERGLLASRILWFYAWKLAWPRDLIFFYPRWEIDAGAWWQYLFAAGAGGAFTALWLPRRLGRGPLVAVLFFAGTLFPALGFFDVYPMRFSYVADHFQYLASIGLITLAVSGAARFLQDKEFPARAGAMAAAAAIILLLGKLTWRQGYMYEDAETLWRVTLAKNPEAWIAHNNLGEILAKRGELDEAVRHFETSLTLGAGQAETHSNLGNAYAIQGRIGDAIAEFEKALAIVPRYPKALNNLGNAYADKGELGKAVSAYKRALEIQPGHPQIHNNLAAAYYSLGKYELAVRHCDKALALGCRVSPKLLSLLKPYR